MISFIQKWLLMHLWGVPTAELLIARVAVSSEDRKRLLRRR